MSRLSITFSIALCLSAPIHLWAQVSYATELDRLRAQHQKAVQAAVEPIDRRYSTDLEQLLRKATQSGDLDTAVKIKDEIKGFHGAAAQSDQPGSGPADPNAREAITGQWDFYAPNWHDVKEFKANGEVHAVGRADPNGHWSIQGNKLIVRFGRVTQTFALPIEENVLRGTTNSPGKKDDDISMKKKVQ